MKMGRACCAAHFFQDLQSGTKPGVPPLQTAGRAFRLLCEPVEGRHIYSAKSVEDRLGVRQGRAIDRKAFHRG